MKTKVEVETTQNGETVVTVTKTVTLTQQDEDVLMDQLTMDQKRDLNNKGYIMIEDDNFIKSYYDMSWFIREIT